MLSGAFGLCQGEVAHDDMTLFRSWVQFGGQGLIRTPERVTTGVTYPSRNISSERLITSLDCAAGVLCGDNNNPLSVSTYLNPFKPTEKT